MLWSVCLLLVALSTGSLAYPEGAPSCDVDKPGHDKVNAANGKEEPIAPQSESSLPYILTKSKTPNSGKWTVTVSAPDDSNRPLVGVLLKANTAGKFTAENTERFKTLEDGQCVTHKDNGPKKGPQVFTFEATNTDEDPVFSAILVQKFDTFWQCLNNKCFQ